MLGGTMDVDDPLDLEVEDSLLSVSPAFPMKKRRKVIGLDDLFYDQKNEEEKFRKKKSKVINSQKCCVSDDDEDKTEVQLSRAVDNFQQMIKEIDGDDASNVLDERSTNITWGLHVFGTQKMLSSSLDVDLQQSMLLQTSMNNELSSLMELSLDKGETFLRGLLLNSLLQKLVLQCGHVEESIARWTFNLLVQSSEESLQAAACDFWCAILLHNEAEITLQIDWLPSYSQLKKALESFGFMLYSPTNGPYAVESTEKDVCRGPPSNVRGWIKFINACFLTRVPRDLNCLRMVEIIPGVDICSRKLKTAISFEVLMTCFPDEVTDAQDILKLIISVNMKDKSCDLFKVHLYLVLIENWLILGIRENQTLINDLWGAFLRNCCTQITNTDFRPYAQEVRNRASYLLQEDGKN